MSNYTVLDYDLPGFKGQAWHILVDGQNYAVSHIDEPQNETIIFPALPDGQIDVGKLIFGGLQVEDFTFADTDHAGAIEQWLARF